MMSTTRAAKMEEQMAALLAKLDQQNAQLLGRMDQQDEQLQLLTRQQAERVDDISRRQMETDEHVTAVEGDLQSVKRTVDGRLSAVEESLSDLAQLQERVGESQESLRHELLRELDVRTGPGRGGALRVTAPPFMPSAGLTSAEDDGRDAGTPAGCSTVSPRGGGGGASEGGHPVSVISGGGALTTAVAGTHYPQQRPAPFDGKLAWDTYRTQFELLAEINR